ncbi:arrestin domain-containing protein 3 isoform X2 [Clupea harengus]|uniref:Arrestin domain-containing protein 3 isoform X2 n=1 Tax=Clupea harengus TaxID=7950 RepID=A0A6P8EZ63_CLUHA|nr:arrestin domain-containing protein 3 isoform X2 [Clupea harengus]
MYLTLTGAVDLGHGRHVYPFTFQLPNKDMPSSFKGCHGKIRYKLLAKLNRSMHVPKKAETHFTFVSKANMADPELMSPQYGSKDKEVKVFAYGNVSMNVSTERTGYHQGEDVAVIAEIVNNSTHRVVPKFYVYQKQSFFARGRRRVVTKDILKEKGQLPLDSSTRRTLTQNLAIPQEITNSILNCRILRVEYRIKDDGSTSKERAARPETVNSPEKNSHHYGWK